MEPKFFNRELSWLEFNARVLNQALKKNLPLMERIQFLAIVSSNFDEFFQVRVAAAKRFARINSKKKDISGLSAKTLLKQISNRAHDIIKMQQECLTEDIIPALEKEKLVYTPCSEFTPRQNEFVHNLFISGIFPLLTPLRTDAREFPHINNLKPHAAFLLKPIEGIQSENNELKGSDDTLRIALVPIPEGLSNVIWLPQDVNSQKKEKRFTLLTDVIELYGTHLFPGFTVSEKLFFKIARDADFAVNENSDLDFINEMENVLVKRESSFVVTLICTDTSPLIKNFLREIFSLTNDDVYVTKGLVTPEALCELRSTDEGANLSYEEWKHFPNSELPQTEPYWDTLKSRDVLLHVPYESYEPVVKFVNDAANDPSVLAIKMTLYRTGRDSAIVAALKNAAHNGKQVTVLVELKARFDEGRNIAWAEELEKAGVIVIYGLVNLKVHAKILLVIRREQDMLRRYVHIATGNYNPRTATLYSDLSLFSANQEIAGDATIFFNLVTGYSTLQPMKHLFVAPVTLKNKILSLIARETEQAEAGNSGLIIAKMNSLTQPEIIQALYKASCAGVKIKLNIRGICMLVPGVKNLSENIKVISIVDRYLEHSRIFYFQNAGVPEMYLASADWMDRNLEKRIELMFPILDKKNFKEIKFALDTYFSDNVNSHELLSDGTWKPTKIEKGENANRAQEILHKYYERLAAKIAEEPKLEFKVRRK